MNQLAPLVDLLEGLTIYDIRDLEYVQQVIPEHRDFIVNGIWDTLENLRSQIDVIDNLAHELKYGIGSYFSLFSGGREKICLLSTLPENYHSIIRIGFYDDYYLYPDVKIYEQPIFFGVSYPVYIDKMRFLHGTDKDVTKEVLSYVRKQLESSGVEEQDLHAGNIRFVHKDCQKEHARLVDYGYSTTQEGFYMDRPKPVKDCVITFIKNVGDFQLTYGSLLAKEYMHSVINIEEFGYIRKNEASDLIEYIVPYETFDKKQVQDYLAYSFTTQEWEDYKHERS